MTNSPALAFGTPGIISLVVGSLLPNVVGLLTRQSLNSGLKAGLLLGVSGLSGVLTQWLGALNNHQHFAWQASALSALATWLVAEGTYLRIWKPSGVSDFLQAKGIADPPSKARHLAQHLRPDAGSTLTPRPVPRLVTGTAAPPTAVNVAHDTPHESSTSESTSGSNAAPLPQAVDLPPVHDQNSRSSVSAGETEQSGPENKSP